MVLTLADLEANAFLTSYARELLVDVISTNDKALVMNLLDKSKKVIVDKESLVRLIHLATEVPDERIVIISNKDKKECECTCCGKAKMGINMFETIEGITINGMLLKDVEPDLHSYIQNTWNISLTRCYCKDFFKISKLSASEKEYRFQEETNEEENQEGVEESDE